MKRRLTFFFLIFTFLFSGSAQQKPTQKWLDQKFSMFIHFGLYSVYGGVYDEKPVERGYSEQIQSFAGIFSDWYGATAKRFNPEKWNPDEIVALAKAAGMRSIVFTSKHHDGFCMYGSRYTDFNIVDATPYKRDLMKELADACRRGGIDFAVYFSLIDWHFPQAYPISSHNADPLTPEHYQFNLKQVEEIMTRYGDISEIWFDMGSLTPAQSKGLYELVNRLQPACMISGRLGNDYVDFAVMADNEYPDYKLGVPWQTAASVFDETWGYRSWQKRGEVQPKVNEKIASLVKVISRGGNYLLNIGPRGDGSVVEFERDVLEEIGKWTNANAEAIYGTHSNPFPHAFDWGDVTTKDGNLYLFVKNEFAGKDIFWDGFQGQISDVNVLSTGEKCTIYPHKMYGRGSFISVPKTSADTPFTVLKVTFNDGFSVSPTLVSGKTLTPQNAVPQFGHSSLNYYGGYKSLLAYEWTIATSRKNISPEIVYTDNEKDKSVLLNIDGENHEIALNNGKPTVQKTAKNSVKWGNLFRKRGKGVFGFVEEENRPFADTHNSDWQKVSAFEYGKKQSEPMEPRRSVMFLQEIESTKEQWAAVEIGSGNAVYILLNGKYLTAHFSPNRVNYETETVLLPLRKGKNQLVIKYYNGYESELNFSIAPQEQWTVYTQKLPAVKLKTQKTHTVSLRSANPESAVAPLRMNNIQVKYE